MLSLFALGSDENTFETALGDSLEGWAGREAGWEGGRVERAEVAWEGAETVGKEEGGAVMGAGKDSE